MSSRNQTTSVLAGVACYVIWGLFPLYWPLLKPAGAFEILSHRIVWSLVFVLAVMVLLRRGWGWVADARRAWRAMLAASVLIAGNWGTYILAVNSGHVVEASLGYFINPLVSVGLGMLVFGERLGRLGKIGCCLAAVGVAVISLESWRTLWISLALAFTFGLYGVVKKRAHLSALDGLAVESAVLAPLALAWLTWLGATGQGQFATSWRSSLLLVTAGVLTAVPLWLFSTAAPGIELGTLGLIQYLSPTMQFLLGLFVFSQTVSTSYWVGIVLVWVGSATYLAGVVPWRRRRAAIAVEG